MSLSFSIAYNHTTKKVTCPRSNTVNQLASLATAKFALPSTVSGTLIHNGKKLDGLLPLRLTNLVNNAKLTLEVVNGSRDVTIKVIGTVLGVSKQKIIKTKTDSTAGQLVDTFSKETDTSLQELRVQLSVLDAKIDNASSDFATITLGTILGSASNAVVRLDAEKKDAQSKREQLEKEQSELRRALEDQKRQERLEEKRRREVEEEKKKAEEKRDSVSKGQSFQDPTLSEQNRSEENGSSDSFVKVDNNEMDIDEQPSNEEPSSNTEALTDEKTRTQGDARSEPENEFEVKRQREDTVYVPNSRTQLYENPESDYNLTVAQAEKYYGIIKSMQQNKRQQPKVHTAPQSYTIRVRFPDRALLDLQIDDSSMKLGQLLKKLDAYVHERHINSYRLKNGVPPFEEVVMGFEENNKQLKQHAQFQHERIMLIWEPTEKSTKGPFLKSDVNTKSLEEMPTIQLETHRGELRDEAQAKGTSSKLGNGTEKKAKKGLPKWFKPSK